MDPNRKRPTTSPGQNENKTKHNNKKKRRRVGRATPHDTPSRRRRRRRGKRRRRRKESGSRKEEPRDDGGGSSSASCCFFVVRWQTGLASHRSSCLKRRLRPLSRPPGRGGGRGLSSEPDRMAERHRVESFGSELHAGDTRREEEEEEEEEGETGSGKGKWEKGGGGCLGLSGRGKLLTLLSRSFPDDYNEAGC